MLSAVWLTPQCDVSPAPLLQMRTPAPASFFKPASTATVCLRKTNKKVGGYPSLLVSDAHTSLPVTLSGPQAFASLTAVATRLRRPPSHHPCSPGSRWLHGLRSTTLLGTCHRHGVLVHPVVPSRAHWLHGCAFSGALALRGCLGSLIPALLRIRRPPHTASLRSAAPSPVWHLAAPRAPSSHFARHYAAATEHWCSAISSRAH
jgi:hypothetical protein